MQKRKIEKAILAVLLTLSFIFEGTSIASNAEEYMTGKTECADFCDEQLIDRYVQEVNSGQYSNVGALFVKEKADFLKEYLSDKENIVNHVGVCNVKNINSYRLINIGSDDDQRENYLLELDCEVYEPDLCFMDGMNYYDVVIVKEGTDRKIAEFSVASNLEEDTVSNIEDEAYYKRMLIASEGDTLQIQQPMEHICFDGNLIEIQANYSPTVLSSYTFPSTIKVKKTGGGVYTLDFKSYCYVVSASEFNCGTDGNTTVNAEALKAFSLCVRNVAWYRCLYPYDANAGYNVTDNTDTQVYKWEYAAQVSSLFPQNVSAMNKVWSVIMLDKNKKLFMPSYRSGKYNGNKSSGESIFYQNGSNYLATELKYDYKQILHYYYDDAIGNLISAGPIIICSSHTASSNYYYDATSHWKTCTVCGKKLNVTGHNYIDSGTYKTCRFCGYRTTNIHVSAAEGVAE